VKSREGIRAGAGRSYGCLYDQTSYQQSLNQSFYFARKDGFSLEGGPNNGGVQNLIHSGTNTGQFTYLKNFRVNAGVTTEKTGN
jgi:hypothetical protein